MGIKYRAGVSLVRRASYKPLGDPIENIEAVSDALGGTPYEWMIDGQ